MSTTDSMIPGEDASHDAALLALQLKPLAKGSSPDEFSARVTYALENHIPFLERPFANETSISGWVAWSNRFRSNTGSSFEECSMR